MPIPFLPKIITDTICFPYIVDIKPFVSLYPSSASVIDADGLVCGACLRESFYKMAGVPASDFGEPRIATELGNVIHDMIANTLKKARLWLGSEVKFVTNTAPPISGRADNFISDSPSSYDPIGLEIKTIDGYRAVRDYITGLVETNPHPKVGDVLQSMIYLDFYSQFDVDTWLLLYVDRGSGAMRQYSLRLGDKGEAIVQCFGDKQYMEVWDWCTMAKIKERWEKFVNYVDKGELPPRDYFLQYSNERIIRDFNAGKFGKTESAKIKKALEKPDQTGPIVEMGDWQCSWCDHKSICYGEEWNETFGKPQIAKPFALPTPKKKDATDPVTKKPTI